MDPVTFVPDYSVKSGADTGCLASKEKEDIAESSEILESNSNDRVLEPSPIQMDETHDNIEKNKEGKLPSEITESNSDDKVEERSQTQRDETHNNEVDKEEKGKKGDEERISYLSLYRAALASDWKTVTGILEDSPDALTAPITPFDETLLHVAVSGSHSIQFVKELLYRMERLYSEQAPPESVAKLVAKSLAITNKIGQTALANSAVFGYTEAAKLLVEKNPDLTQMRNKFEYTPLHLAALFGHEKTVRYLLDETQDKEDKERPSPFSEESGVRMLNGLISADFYDIALDLLNRYPKLPVHKAYENRITQKKKTKRPMRTTSPKKKKKADENRTASALETLAEKAQVFASGSQLGFWQRIIYHYISVEMDNVPPKPTKGGDVEDPKESSQKCSFLQQISNAFGTQCGKAYAMLWIIIRHLKVPRVNQIHDAKLMHKKSLELVKLMCEKVILSGENVEKSFKKPLFIATKLGNHEFVREIIKAFPQSRWFKDEHERNIFQLAVLHRHEKIFGLIHQMDLHKKYVTSFSDKFGNNLLHSAGKLEPSTQVSGAALQMQRELQWFKEVEKFVQPSLKEKKNKKGKTPKMVFTENHEELVKQGEKWMKATASSCTVVAALITTVVFAAAFTVPGGNNSDQGIPIFLHDLSFIVFAVADAIALFSSSTSMLMFLGILTSRYSEEDFLKSLPMKLIIGLLTLFISIASMMIAFSATLYIVLVHRFNWVVIPIASLACLPVTLFAFLQFPLLVEIVHSTYGPSIFHQESKNLWSNGNVSPPTSVRNVPYQPPIPDLHPL